MIIGQANQNEINNFEKNSHNYLTNYGKLFIINADGYVNGMQIIKIFRRYIMKNLKISLTAIIFAIILMISTGVFANTGVAEVDPTHKIAMPSSLSNGEGVVTGISSYQFVEITQAKYNSIKQIEAQYELIQMYVKYAANPTDENLTRQWSEACDKYTKQYGGTVTDVLNKYGMGPDSLTLCENAWIVELGDFDSSKWTPANNNKISIDLTTFKGTKYYVAWVRVGDTYDAEAYRLVGTKKDEPKPENNTVTNNTVNNNTVQNNTVENNTVQNNTINNNTVANTTKNETPKDNTTVVKKDDTTTTKSIPYTGVGSAILGLIGLAGGAAGVSYRKYSKIK